MRSVVLYALLSLDGVAEAPDRWLFDFDEVLEENLAAVIAEQDAVLLGRQMYDEWSDYWPTSDIEPFASFINGVQKYVATATALGRDWAPTTVLDGPLEELVAELKQTIGGVIGIHGSITLARSLLRADLVDELRLVVAPTTAGDGRRLFDSEAPLLRWSLVRSQQTPSGALTLHYRRTS